MNQLREAFLRQEALRRDNDFVDRLQAVAQFGFGLFDMGTFTVFLESADASFSGRKMWVEIERLRKYPFQHVIDEWGVLQAFDPMEYLFEKIKTPLFNHFRYRPALPVDDHIILGED